MTAEGVDTVRLSLIISTLGRDDVLGSLFDSLCAQTFKDFEVIVVDQNDSDGVVRIDPPDYPFRVRLHRSPGDRGISRGRNTGWRLARGEFLLFPDDDCRYPPEFMARAVAEMDRRRCGMLTGRATGRGRFERRAQRIEAGNAWTTSLEWMTLVRREVLETIGGYDERLGVGASTPWQSAEGQDLLLRAIARGIGCWYDPALAGDSLQPGRGPVDRQVRRRARAYGRGMGFVLREHAYPLRTKAWWIARALGGAVVALLRGRIGRARYHVDIALGRFEGVLGRTFGPAIYWEPTWKA